MNSYEMIPIENDSDIKKLCALAREIWTEHFTPILKAGQVDYMLEKFQSFEAIKRQLAEGYEYYFLCFEGKFAGYTGIHIEQDALFLSKLYVKKEERGKRIAKNAIKFLCDLCKEKGLSKIWLTVNRYNANTIAAYHKMGFVTVREQKADIGN